MRARAAEAAENPLAMLRLAAGGLLPAARSAMRELRRLIDLHPGTRSRRRLLARLAELKR